MEAVVEPRDDALLGPPQHRRALFGRGRVRPEALVARRRLVAAERRRRERAPRQVAARLPEVVLHVARVQGGVRGPAAAARLTIRSRCRGAFADYPRSKPRRRRVHGLSKADAAFAPRTIHDQSRGGGAFAPPRSKPRRRRVHGLSKGRCRVRPADYPRSEPRRRRVCPTDYPRSKPPRRPDGLTKSMPRPRRRGVQRTIDRSRGCTADDPRLGRRDTRGLSRPHRPPHPLSTTAPSEYPRGTPRRGRDPSPRR
mmetsp:Transcript_13343/g.41162  ORF Transcript_13343/g.41162 Transcript_13343/m.41162 type:complete len:254 (+) Transcript_13343:696-1457(+)